MIKDNLIVPTNAREKASNSRDFKDINNIHEYYFITNFRLTDFGKTSEVFFRSLSEVRVYIVDGVHLIKTG